MDVRKQLGKAVTVCRRLRRLETSLRVPRTRRAGLLHLGAAIMERVRLRGAAVFLLDRLCHDRSFLTNPYLRHAYRALGNERLSEGVSREGLSPASRDALAFARNRGRLAGDVESGRVETGTHPVYVTFLMIDKCQAACHMCGGDYRASDTKRRITLDAYRRMLEHLRMPVVDHVTFGGGGEPLLNPDVMPIAEYTAEHFGHVHMRIITNGISLRPEVARRLLRAGVDFDVSVNAATAETWRKVFLLNQFATVARNVRELARLRDETGSPSRIELSIALSRVNVAELPALVELAHQWGADHVLACYVRFYPPSVRYKRFTARDDDLLESQSLYHHQEESDRCLAEAMRLAERYGLGFSSEPGFSAPFATSTFREKPCEYAWQALLVGYGGEVYFCPGGEVLFRHQVEGGLYATGNLLAEDIEAIRNNAFHHRLRRTVSGASDEIPECQVCGNCIKWHGPRARKSHLLEWEGLRGPNGAAIVVPEATLFEKLASR